ncbi:MAG TPA: LacI family DNA-binding transcriptional regulator [Casimicrobiaceae bacterium]|nr:LacI family DNA-binding transcriptional regulator [Casimicrobiaceae bacterium]
MVNLKEVAALAGVSAATVSRTLSAPHLVNARTRERVQRAIAELDYLPHGPARALRSNRTGSIGAVVPSLNNELYASGTDALQQVLEARGYTLLVTSYHYDAAVEVRSVRTLLQRGVDGLVLVGRQHDHALYDLIAKRRVPYVLAWALDDTGDHPSVGYSNREASATIARHLLGLGHLSFAMISGPLERSDRARDRVEGVRGALATRGLALRPTHLVETAYTLAAGSEAMTRLLAVRPRPTAVICGNDLIAVAAIDACREQGLDVPHDVSVAGFGAMEIAGLRSPSVTTIRSPVAAIGEAAGALLLARIAGETRPPKVEFEAELVVRGSTGPAPRRARSSATR